MDVKITFLHNELDEMIAMSQQAATLILKNLIRYVILRSSYTILNNHQGNRFYTIMIQHDFS